MKSITNLFLFVLITLIFLVSCTSEVVKEDDPKEPHENEEKLKNQENPHNPINPTRKTSTQSLLLISNKDNSYSSGKGSISPFKEFDYPQPEHNTEQYDRIYENEFRSVLDNPLSTFSIDVDAASYGNVRRFINGNTLPPKDAVRIEEMINYFDYDYPQPKSEDPFAIVTEVTSCPWNNQNKLIHIGLKGKEISRENLPSSNLVFLLDVSGSMRSSNKLPLLKKAFKLLVDQLSEKDRIAITVYAGSAGVVLPSTGCDEKEKIVEALDKLQAGGSTAGSAGIKLAYEIAKENFIEGSNNRVIIATDGDFNVGPSSDSELVRMIEEKREEGIFLTVLGFGMGNYKDSRMEKLADKGNGNYAYIDNILEAKKVFVNELSSTLFTIAKDVKIQVEFNPQLVKGYRLIGYENRMLNKEDFNDDKKDAGELGAGHTVTVLYEIIPPESEFTFPNIDPLKYQSDINESRENTNELLTVKFRYKEPDGDKSKLILKSLVKDEISFEESSENLRFASSVAMFGMLLRDSKFKGNSNYKNLKAIAENSMGKDKFDYRAEFLKLVDKAELISGLDGISMRDK
jgi:Ca-activated chloride channel family protein